MTEKKIFAISKPEFNTLMDKNNISDKTIEEKTDLAVISINDSYGSWSISWFDNDHPNVLRLWFDDISENIDIYIAFSAEQAQWILDFLETNKDKETFIVHCSAGIARSGAVAQFICDYFRCDNKEFRKANPHISPNPYVLRVLNNLSRYKNYNF